MSLSLFILRSVCAAKVFFKYGFYEIFKTYMINSIFKELGLIVIGYLITICHGLIQFNFDKLFCYYN